MAPARADVVDELRRVRDELYGRVLPFWMLFSYDGEHGGFFNNLTESGAVFDTTKHVWLQARQCWMFARVANTHTEAALAARFAAHAPPPRAAAHSSAETACAPSKAAATPLPLTRAALVRAARHGLQFLREHAFAPDGTVHFALTRAGAPVLQQRKIFSAAFLVMALGEVSRASGEPPLFDEAVALLERMLAWARTPGSLGKASLPGATPFEPLNVPMITLNVIVELSRCLPPARAGEASTFFAAERRAAAARVLAHAHPGARCVLENVLPDGRADFATPEGRLINPGHAIEAAWFLLEHARAEGDAGLEATARMLVEWSWERGWDVGRGGGGMLYFVDAEGFSPTQLEWSMKLWWPVCEAMIATAMACERGVGGVSGDDRVAAMFSRYVAASSWAYAHLADHGPEGEWFGYCDRDGVVTHRFKGGPYKGCFHVPRALLYVEAAFERVLAESADDGPGAACGATASACA